jgi:hypothetical protein
MPFNDRRAGEIYAAVREVLEDKPFYWRVVRADDSVEDRGLWSNQKAKLLRAHCYVAILTGAANPNVMIEIGRMEALERPTLLLRDHEAEQLPADLHGLLYAELRASGGELAAEVRDAVSRHEALRALNGRDRFLSERVLTRDGGLNDQVSREISRRCPTWRTFLGADSPTIARSVGLNPAIIDGVKQTLAALNTAEG